MNEEVNRHQAPAFYCVDCHVVKLMPDAQVLWGQQQVDVPHEDHLDQLYGVVGRCSVCGFGLPVIAEDQPYVWRSRLDETAYRIRAMWSTRRQRWLLSLERELFVPLLANPVRHVSTWEFVEAYELERLRQIMSTLFHPPITADEVLDVALALERIGKKESLNLRDLVTP